MKLRRAATVAIVVAASFVPAQAAHAQIGSAASITMTSEQGDPISQGQRREISTARGDVLNYALSIGGGLWISVQTADGGLWSLNFSTPDGRPLQPGVYANAGLPGDNPGRPGLLVYGEGRGCTELTGSFTVESITAGPVDHLKQNETYLQSLDLSFEQHCQNFSPALRGHIHIAEPPAPPITVALSANRSSPVTAGEAVTLTARGAPKGVTGLVFLLEDGRAVQTGDLGDNGDVRSVVPARPGVHEYTAQMIRIDRPDQWFSPVLRLVAASPTPSLTLTVDPPDQVTVADLTNHATVTAAVAGLPAEPGELHIYDGNVDLGPGPAVTLAGQEAPHQLVAVFIPADAATPQPTSAIVPYLVRPCTCVPMQARNDTQPYAGSLTLNVAAGTRTTLTQVDPATPAGHPVQATDPTGHRHAWVFTGHLAGVSVAETRPEHPGWELTGQAGNFVNGTTVLPAANLGWRPALEADPGDAEGEIVVGTGIPSRLADPTSPGLGETGTMAGGGRLGTVRLGADLELRMPDTSPTGHYTSVLTLTLISP